MIRVLVQSLKIATIALAAVLVLFGSVRAFDYYRDQAVAEGRVGKSVVVTIRSRDDSGAVADKLSDAGLINSKTYFEMLLRFSGKDLKPASYTLKIGTSTRTIVDLITTEKSEAKVSNKELTITVPEGWRTEQIAEELENLGLNGGADAFMKAVQEYDSDQFDFLDDRPDKKSIEGYLFPDTYTFKADTPPVTIIEMMLLNFDSKFDQSLRDRADEMGLTLNEVLVFASLVEREAQINRERPLIAGIYLTRFERNIRLESDPTVQYALGKSGKWWEVPTEEDLFTESPYNTYQNDGLPPGPICNPGMDSILGVLQPADTEYIYFVADPSEDGSHLFAIDADSQAQNINYRNGVADSPAFCANPWDEGCPLNDAAAYIPENDLALVSPSRTG